MVTISNMDRDERRSRPRSRSRRRSPSRRRSRKRDRTGDGRRSPSRRRSRDRGGRTRSPRYRTSSFSSFTRVVPITTTTVGLIPTAPASVPTAGGSTYGGKEISHVTIIISVLLVFVVILLAIVFFLLWKRYRRSTNRKGKTTMKCPRVDHTKVTVEVDTQSPGVKPTAPCMPQHVYEELNVKDVNHACPFYSDLGPIK